MKATMINLTVTMCVCKSLLTIQAKKIFIQMLLPAMVVSGITQAASGQSGCHLRDPRLYDPYPEPGGNVCLKAYVNFINPPGNSWISQAEADASAGKTMEALEELPFISDEEERKQTQDTIYRLRLGMNREASLVLQHYALDTVEAKADSILRWLELAETFSADYHRARHYFFTGQLALFDRLWPDLPYFYELTEAGLADNQALNGGRHSMLINVFLNAYP